MASTKEWSQCDNPNKTQMKRSASMRIFRVQLGLGSTERNLEERRDASRDSPSYQTITAKRAQEDKSKEQDNTPKKHVLEDELGET